MEIGAKRAVTIHYTLRDDEGKVLDSSEGREPLTYLHGAGNIVPGLEAALEGKKAGDAIKAKVTPADGYGERDETNIRNVPLRKLPEGKVEAGMRLPRSCCAMSSSDPAPMGCGSSRRRPRRAVARSCSPRSIDPR